MNIFRVFNTISYALFIHLLLFSRRILVESGDTSTSTHLTSPKTNAAEGGDGSTTTPPPGEANESGDGSTVKPSENGTDTTPGETANKTGVELSLKVTAATNEFNYKKDGKTITYTAKDNYGFKSVKTGDKLVWETTNHDEYASKVVLDGKGQKQKKVTIYLPNNTTRVFNRDSKGKPWNEFGFEINIKSGEDKSSNEKFELNVDGDHKTYNIKPGKHCTLVKVEDQLVWKYDPSKFNGDHPTVISCYKNEKLFVCFGREFVAYEKGNDGNWNDLSNTAGGRGSGGSSSSSVSKGERE
ncbi:hypothetical protein MACJ_002515 [Theileria orientalis]|uniref:SfiI-subtelomeric related protein family member n=1 Tax=Theileria orientalis TaxID=68886 RepID=A0A976M7S1_THEOR|nr:hypothetical protein MACJ_002515 [Theileria orientalis]